MSNTDFVNYSAKNGEILKFDTREWVFKRFGFRPGTRVYTPKGLATVIGAHEGLFWFHIDGDAGASYWDTCKTKRDLVKLGVRVVETHKQINPKLLESLTQAKAALDANKIPNTASKKKDEVKDSKEVKETKESLMDLAKKILQEPPEQTTKKVKKKKPKQPKATEVVVPKEGKQMESNPEKQQDKSEAKPDDTTTTTTTNSKAEDTQVPNGKAESKQQPQPNGKPKELKQTEPPKVGGKLTNSTNGKSEENLPSAQHGKMHSLDMNHLDSNSTSSKTNMGDFAAQQAESRSEVDKQQVSKEPRNNAQQTVKSNDSGQQQIQVEKANNVEHTDKLPESSNKLPNGLPEAKQPTTTPPQHATELPTPQQPIKKQLEPSQKSGYTTIPEKTVVAPPPKKVIETKLATDKPKETISTTPEVKVETVVTLKKKKTKENGAPDTEKERLLKESRKKLVDSIIAEALSKKVEQFEELESEDDSFREFECEQRLLEEYSSDSYEVKYRRMCGENVEGLNWNQLDQMGQTLQRALRKINSAKRSLMVRQILAIEKMNEKLELQNGAKCKICDKNTADRVAFPCKHRSICKSCISDSVTSCPFCGKTINLIMDLNKVDASLIGWLAES